MNSPPFPIPDSSSSLPPKLRLSFFLSLPSLAEPICQIITPGFGFVINKAGIMNGCVYRQNFLVGCVGNMARGADSDGVVCPKPRRVGLTLQFDEPIRSSSRLLHINNEQSEASDAKAGAELLDTILIKGSCGYARSNFQVASSPPFFSGSPPTRTSNPVIQDEQFGNGNFNPLSTALEASLPPPSSARKSGGCVRVSFGHKPATVRIEGFNCHGNCSISAVA